MSSRPAVVLDCGTGYTKAGFACNLQPSFVIPTAIATNDNTSRKLDDLDFYIGDEALAHSATHSLSYPVKQGLVENWDHMERFLQQSIFQYLRVDPEDHQFVVSEPPMCPPEAREALAEVMFETFGVAGLYVGVQAVLALVAGNSVAGDRQSHVSPTRGLTGCVVDSGEGVTHIIPVVDGFVLASSIRSLPLAGRDVTQFVQQMMRERNESVPSHMWADVARSAKERYCYVCPDMEREIVKFDTERERMLRRHQGVNGKTNQEFVVDVGCERFLAPEIFFTPDIAPTQAPVMPLHQAVDAVIQSCPIDCRRALYGNIVLSGGSTMFKNFGRRLEEELRHITAPRLGPGARALDIRVVTHALQRHAVWLGGSILAAGEAFGSVCHTREQYQEYGPSICRQNLVFKDA